MPHRIVGALIIVGVGVPFILLLFYRCGLALLWRLFPYPLPPTPYPTPAILRAPKQIIVRAPPLF